MKTLNISPVIRENMGKAIAAEKCWKCGCQENSIVTIESAIGKLPEEAREEIEPLLARSKETFKGVEYDCLGCKICYPAVMLNEFYRLYPDLEYAGESCGVEERPSTGDAKWPPLPGDYNTLRYAAPVAVCTLSSDAIKETLIKETGKEVSIVGGLQTESLGIERLIQNVIANPNIRFLLVCGRDSAEAVGHYPGQSLVALTSHGLDERGRIIGAKGKRPILKNISREAVNHFRQTVEVIDMIGNDDITAILQKTRECGQRKTRFAKSFQSKQAIQSIKGYIPKRMVSDPAGFFVVFIDRDCETITLEHYSNHGVLDSVITGKKAAQLVFPAIDKGLVSRLDHAAYLGRELARAEVALQTGGEYVQDAAPEQSINVKKETCACPSGGKEEK